MRPSWPDVLGTVVPGTRSLYQPVLLQRAPTPLNPLFSGWDARCTCGCSASLASPAAPSASVSTPAFDDRMPAFITPPRCPGRSLANNDHDVWPWWRWSVLVEGPRECQWSGAVVRGV